MFRFEASPGTVVRLRADPTGASLRAQLEVRDPTGKLAALHRDDSARFAVAEVLVTGTGDYSAALDDRRNVDARTLGNGAFVGGTGYGYSLTAEALVLAPTALATTAVDVTVPAHTARVLVKR